VDAAEGAVQVIVQDVFGAVQVKVELGLPTARRRCSAEVSAGRT
jgi:hypothetical protein